MRSSEHEEVGQLVTMAIVGFPRANEQRNIGVVDLLDGVSRSVLSVASTCDWYFAKILIRHQVLTIYIIKYFILYIKLGWLSWLKRRSHIDI